MLFKISLLTSLLFSTLYPLCFLISFNDQLKNNFHRFHLGISCCVAGLSTIIFWFYPFALKEQQVALIIWSIFLLIVAGYYWTKPSVNPVIITLPCIAGLIITLQILNTWIPLNFWIALLTILAGIIFCASLFAMNLGHWYLNVHGLPLHHLQRSVYVFWAAVALRAIADVYLLSSQKIIVHGELFPIYKFILSIEGFLLIIAILFGTIFPLICLYFVKGTLDVKSTQSATGILYAILCGVVIGDIAYKYYLLKYGIIL
ncbi:MAG: hypothetical protein H6754_04555 [Candidatus Omnitrophica bacterium]|nr:hypothetical protein [Candidatus Omnitrophota bacterium]